MAILLIPSSCFAESLFFRSIYPAGLLNNLLILTTLSPLCPKVAQITHSRVCVSYPVEHVPRVGGREAEARPGLDDGRGGEADDHHPYVPLQHLPAERSGGTEGKRQK